MPKPVQPNFVLGVETSELFIQAGLQDRVIQVCAHVYPEAILCMLRTLGDCLADYLVFFTSIKFPLYMYICIVIYLCIPSGTFMLACILCTLYVPGV